MNIDFAKGNGLVPAIIQDVNTDKVLMLGYMNEESLAETQKTSKVTFYSRSKKRLWTKGETSGNFLWLDSITVDCDNDTILIKAKPEGPACHTGADTCFNEKNVPHYKFINQLEEIIKDRYENPDEGSYTSQLFALGINKVAQKVGEEAVEIVIEAKDDNKDLFLNEAADLIYHYLVLLRAKGFDLKDVEKILYSRNK
jgi:phosphoribosyl-ATP pyrophosphohydrolase/phosphoribosyl-AMP cyclohydrolase